MIRLAHIKRRIPSGWALLDAPSLRVLTPKSNLVGNPRFDEGGRETGWIRFEFMGYPLVGVTCPVGFEVGVETEQNLTAT
jgi:hypothetical protein|eukprot:scaffold2457_cov110-Alexandrium_tamarense.AAC.2